MSTAPIDWLIVGARPGSLGWGMKALLEQMNLDVVTLGLTPGAEDYFLDLLDDQAVSEYLDVLQPGNVLCTAGINKEDTAFDPDFGDSFSDHMAVNAYGPLKLLSRWVQGGGAQSGSKFCAVSSNSAHIARSRSTSYCMSKAALSMGIRCAARDFAKTNGPRVSIFAMEFGLLAGTPMTKEVEERIPEGAPLSRMVGMESGIPVMQACEVLMGWLMSETFALNGTTLRVDAGEQ